MNYFKELVKGTKRGGKGKTRRQHKALQPDLRSTEAQEKRRQDQGFGPITLLMGLITFGILNSTGMLDRIPIWLQVVAGALCGGVFVALGIARTFKRDRQNDGLPPKQVQVIRGRTGKSRQQELTLWQYSKDVFQKYVPPRRLLQAVTTTMVLCVGARMVGAALAIVLAVIAGVVALFVADVALWRLKATKEERRARYMEILDGALRAMVIGSLGFMPMMTEAEALGLAEYLGWNTNPEDR